MYAELVAKPLLITTATPDRLIGESAVMVELKRTARVVAGQNCALLISGESGTGKEAFARYIHENSDRAEHPFIPVDCSSLNDKLLEDELFGTARRADDGSTRDSLGFLRAANGGSIYLEEISQLSMPLQLRLLRVILENAVTATGAGISHPVNVRIFAATTGDLALIVQQGRFSNELFQLLTGCVFTTPRLCDRPKDILPLAEHFLKIQSELHNEPLRKISDQVAQILQTYHWPGNVRELNNVIEQAHVLASFSTLQPSDLPLRLQKTTSLPAEKTENLSLEDMEKQAILTAMKRCNYNRAAAGRMLGISMQRLKRRIARLGL